jgi:deazaflavin-dependent oxidoreductase (nitroreductase family)
VKIVERKPTGLLRAVLRTPIWFYRNGLGWLFGHRLAYIVHIGRKSGLRREVVAEVVRHDPSVPEIVVIAAWGREPDWYRNLKAAPAAEVRVSRLRWEDPSHRFLGTADTVAVLRDYRRARPHAWKRIAPILGFPVDLDTEAVPDAHAIAFTR